jgi:hypothetical protein
MALLVRDLTKSGFDEKSAQTNPPAAVVSGEAFELGQSLEWRADNKVYKYTGTLPLAGVAADTVPGANHAVGMLRQGSRFTVGAVVVPGKVYFAAAGGAIDDTATASDPRGAFMGGVQMDAANNPVDYYMEIIHTGKLN